MSNHMLRDSAAVRVITIVTLMYLPSSFVSVCLSHHFLIPTSDKYRGFTNEELSPQGFFGMGFFATSDDEGVTWAVAPYVWVYVLVAIPLTITTLAYWKWKIRNHKKVSRQGISSMA